MDSEQAILIAGYESRLRQASVQGCIDSELGAEELEANSGPASTPPSVFPPLHGLFLLNSSHSHDL